MESYRQRKTLVLKEENQLITLLDQKNPETEEWLGGKRKNIKHPARPGQPLAERTVPGNRRQNRNIHTPFRERPLLRGDRHPEIWQPRPERIEKENG